MNTVDQIIRSMYQVNLRYQEPVRAVISRSYLDEMLKDLSLCVASKNAGFHRDSIAGVPFVVNDDPLAPDYLIDFILK